MIPGERLLRCAAMLGLGVVLALNRADANGPESTFPPARLDVNRASPAQLALLPGIGPGLAARIVAARAERPFDRAEDLERVHGLGPRKVEGIRDWIRF